MKTIELKERLTPEEKETIIVYDSIEKKWIMDSTIPKHFRKALKQGWTPISQCVYDDGTVCAMTLSAPERSITIRSTTKKQMSEKQLGNLNGSDE